MRPADDLFIMLPRLMGTVPVSVGGESMKIGLITSEQRTDIIFNVLSDVLKLQAYNPKRNYKEAIKQAIESAYEQGFRDGQKEKL